MKSISAAILVAELITPVLKAPLENKGCLLGNLVAGKTLINVKQAKFERDGAGSRKFGFNETPNELDQAL